VAKPILMLAILVALLAVSVGSQRAALAQQPVEPNVVPLKVFSRLAADKRFETVSGNPSMAGAPYFAFSKTATIIQVHGIGPFATQWLVPMYELSEKGVLLKDSAVDLGRPVPKSPEGCFVLKLGTPVRGTYGEGVVVGAQCTPGQFTQYRVEEPGGELFWALREELTTP
jgi:hypothetical protein